MSAGRKFALKRFADVGIYERIFKLFTMFHFDCNNFPSARKIFKRDISRRVRKEAIKQKHAESVEAAKQVAQLEVSDDLAFAFGKESSKDLMTSIVWMRRNQSFKLALADLEGHAVRYPQKPLDEPERNRQLEDNKLKAESSSDPQYQAIRRCMMDLPVRNYESQLLKLINHNTYSICAAETGSGKSTQIPQLILDDAISRSKGARCRILCVQPRRLAAIRLAQRVAAERCEEIGDSVGYTVRFDHKPPKNGGSIEYCTSGILMNMLKDDSLLDRFTHIILDEVHTREVQLDIAMMALKRRIMERQKISREAHVPRVTLMSATVNVDLFAKYFSTTGVGNQKEYPAPHITIPGRSFAVKRHYLEEVLQSFTHTLPPETVSTLLQRQAPTADFLNNHFKVHGNQSQDEVSTPLESARQLDEKKIASGLVSATIISLLVNKKQGSFLVFVPGMFQMDEIIADLNNVGPRLGFDFRDSARFKIIRLHSELPKEQEELAVPVPEGCQRIIIATDIAEASVTFPDIHHVIDTGKRNQLDIDPAQEVRELMPCWISKAASQQREGRAGRVREGDYYFLGSSNRYESLAGAHAAEIKRTSLEETCLHLRKMISGIPLSVLLAETIEPPSEDRITSAVENLKHLRALDKEENLTGLGRILEKLDMDPSFGKMVILGVIFGCLDPMLILASFASGNDFNQVKIPEVSLENFRRIRRSFEGDSLSDHMFLINSFQAMRKAMSDHRIQAETFGLDSQNEITHKIDSLDSEFAKRHFLNLRPYRKAVASASLIMDKLGVPFPRRSRKSWLTEPFASEAMNRNSGNTNLIKALLVHCLAPKLAVRQAGGTKVYVNLNPGIRGVSIPRRKKKTAMFAYGYKYSTALVSLGIRNVTQVRPLAACLLTHNLEQNEGALLLDSWLKFNIKTESLPETTVAENLYLHHKTLSMVSILPFLISSCTNLIQGLQTAFDLLSVESCVKDMPDKGKFLGLRRKLQKNLEKEMDLIVSLDSPSTAVHDPKHWETQWNDEDFEDFEDS
ncbi:unnamed protein product [Penicillium salamii]|uniref:Uncharacterized protein n=1 Tax=Penicillium salamii TaxID=1612424 RepID=A0A9W4K020_9EURO|nr:unnamed protein product [Penicillium salamii]CAG8390842.1 unnamed protein product [Penicillium salamii]CAG8393940.1 unnamed protein product [Penicillium salamii]CAG8422760.1 unnamed protein product [Penicillium salamii]